MEILIEPMLFGDYRVAVYDEKQNSILDKDYFCRGILSAELTAGLIKRDLFPEAEIKIFDNSTGTAHNL